MTKDRYLLIQARSWARDLATFPLHDQLPVHTIVPKPYLKLDWLLWWLPLGMVGISILRCEVMLRVRVVMILVLLSACCASAQETPKAEIFGGVSLVPTGLFEDDLTGVHVSAAGNVNPWLGVEVDFSHHRREFFVAGNMSETFFMAGPRFSYRRRFTPSAHVLLGGSRMSEPGVSSGAFAVAIGGGVDWVLHRRFAVRLIQVDWLNSRD